MDRFAFVGPHRSPLRYDPEAPDQGGGQTAKQLHDALVALGIDPAAQRYLNLYEEGPEADRDPERVRERIRTLREWQAEGFTIVSVGALVGIELDRHAISGRISLVHPSHRGSTHGRANWLAHVRQRLLGTEPPTPTDVPRRANEPEPPMDGSPPS